MSDTQAATLIIGGGIMGCSLAYHLARGGAPEVLLVEKATLTSGSTWHAAGQVTHSVSHPGLARMAKYATELYADLERESGQSCTWHACGSLRLAYTEDERDWLNYTASVGRGLNLPLEVIKPARIAELHPFYQLDGVIAALHTPEDGHVDPAGATQALAKAARQYGARIIQNRRVTGLTHKPNGEFIAHTEHGDITAACVVNAGGVYARQIAAWLGINLPIANLLHHYLVTESVPEFAALDHELPVIRDDREVSGYVRMEQNSGLVGIYEKANATTVWDEGAPWSAEHELFEPDYERIMPWLNNAMQRMPILAERGIRRVIHGAITHPPDGNMILGPSEIPGFWHCCGAQVGIAWGPGAGKYLAQWMLDGAPDISMQSFHPLRFGAKLDNEYRLTKAKEDYLLRHEIPYPGRDRPACRPTHSKTTPLYETLKQQGAVYEDIYGWERPAWFATEDIPPQPIHSFRRSALQHIVEREVHAVRHGAAIADTSAFAKIEIHGPHATPFLTRVCHNALPQQNKIRLTCIVHTNERIEAEATIIKLAEDCYYLVYAAAREASVLAYLQARLAPDEAVEIINLSNKYGVLMLAGPEARNILQQTTTTPLDNAHFPWLSGRAITIADASVRAMRLSYSGELGWELHMRLSDMAAVYTALGDAAKHATVALTPIGSAALNSLRMDKRYLSGHELSHDITLAEAGLTRRRSTFAPRWRLIYLCLGEPPSGALADPSGGEAVLYQGEVIGALTSGAYSYTAAAFIAFAYIEADVPTDIEAVEVMVANQPRHAEVLTTPVWDAENTRQRA